MQEDYDQMIDRESLVPHSNEAEQAVIGAILRDNHAYELLPSFDWAFFYVPAHQIIGKAIVELLELGRPVDVLTLNDHISIIGKSEEIGGLDYLNQLFVNTPSSKNVARYYDIVRDRYYVRCLLEECSSTIDEIHNPQGMHSDELLDRAESRIMRIAETRSVSDFVDIKQVLKQVVAEQMELQKGQRPKGLSTGLLLLDDKLCGLKPGELIIIAGRPGSGKTALALNIAENVFRHHSEAVGIFSMEMGSDQLIKRIISSMGEIDQQNMRNGSLTDAEMHRYIRMTEELANCQLHIDETPGLTPIELRTKARRLHRKVKGIGLLVVDYLQLMSGSLRSKDTNRTMEIGEISRSLKNLARELECPIIALSQLSRAVESRADKHPMMSDLRESGSIEQDADVVLFIYRDEYYNKENSTKKGIADIDIAKQRSGPTGRIEVAFTAQYTRFSNLAKESDNPYPVAPSHSDTN